MDDWWSAYAIRFHEIWDMLNENQHKPYIYRLNYIQPVYQNIIYSTRYPTHKTSYR